MQHTEAGLHLVDTVRVQYPVEWERKQEQELALILGRLEEG